jgi:hypothetical protein
MHKKNEWAQANTVWKTEFIYSNVVLEEHSTKRLYMVQVPGGHAVSVYEVHLEQVNELFTRVKLDTDWRNSMAYKPEFIHIFDFHQWRVWQTALVGPNQLHYKYKVKVESDCPQLQLTESYSMLEHAALKAFKGVAAPTLAKLVRWHPDVPEDKFGIKDTTVIANCEIMVRAIYPGIEDKALAEIMAQHLATNKNCCSQAGCG